MHWACVDGKKTKLSPGRTGICRLCRNEVIAKCGRIRTWHWAHKSTLNCDAWSEPESDWHLAWKDQFPSDWQETVLSDEISNEKHIADIETTHGLVIEFQSSPISFQERESRELFYKNMIWVVNGNSQPDDWYGRLFVSGLSNPLCFDPLTYGVWWRARSRFLRNWVESDVAVYFDFGQTEGIHEPLWRVVDWETEPEIYIVQPIARDWLVASCLRGESIPSARVEEKDRHKYKRELQLVGTLDQKGAKLFV